MITGNLFKVKFATIQKPINSFALKSIDSFFFHKNIALKWVIDLVGKKKNDKRLALCKEQKLALVKNKFILH